MAEVSLTFSNEDAIAPPGYESYSEVQVTRRTFRDGESEFSINRRITSYNVCYTKLLRSASTL